MLTLPWIWLRLPVHWTNSNNSFEISEHHKFFQEFYKLIIGTGRIEIVRFIGYFPFSSTINLRKKNGTVIRIDLILRSEQKPNDGK